MIYTQIGVYKGRIFAVKKVRKKSIEITREMKKELKVVSTARVRIARLNCVYINQLLVGWLNESIDFRYVRNISQINTIFDRSFVRLFFCQSIVRSPIHQSIDINKLTLQM